MNKNFNYKKLQVGGGEEKEPKIKDTGKALFRTTWDTKLNANTVSHFECQSRLIQNVKQKSGCKFFQFTKQTC